MTKGVENLINAIAEGDSQGIQSAFETEMANRISERLEDMRIEVARGLFKEQAEEIQEETEVQTEEPAAE